MPRRLFYILLVAIPLVLLGIFVWEMRPVRQVERHLIKLTRALEDRNWDRIRKMMAADYKDAWGMSRETAVKSGSEAFRQFFFLQVVFRNPAVIEMKGHSAVSRVKLGLGGRGTSIAEAIIEHANGLNEDFVFEWRRESWKPWDWKLTSVRQPELHFDPSSILQ